MRSACKTRNKGSEALGPVPTSFSLRNIRCTPVSYVRLVSRHVPPLDGSCSARGARGGGTISTKPHSPISNHFDIVIGFQRIRGLWFYKHHMHWLMPLPALSCFICLARRSISRENFESWRPHSLVTAGSARYKECFRDRPACSCTIS